MVTPYQSKDSKKQQVEQMFDNIAPRYDLLNRLLSMGIDVQWRKKAIKQLAAYSPQIVLDIATGTGDFALAAMALKPERIIGIDISNEMLRIGREKVKNKGAEQVIVLCQGDSEALGLNDASVDAITVGFGVRNFENLPKGMSEIYRVLRRGGAVAILEPGFPQQFPLKQLFNFYFKVVTPRVGRMISGDGAAYSYLPDSVQAFPPPKQFISLCEETGFTKCTFYPLSWGICAFYLLEK